MCLPLKTLLRCSLCPMPSCRPGVLHSLSSSRSPSPLLGTLYFSVPCPFDLNHPEDEILSSLWKRLGWTILGTSYVWNYFIYESAYSNQVLECVWVLNFKLFHFGIWQHFYAPFLFLGLLLENLNLIWFLIVCMYLSRLVSFWKLWDIVLVPAFLKIYSDVLDVGLFLFCVLGIQHAQ